MIIVALLSVVFLVFLIRAILRDAGFNVLFGIVGAYILLVARITKEPGWIMGGAQLIRSKLVREIVFENNTVTITNYQGNVLSFPISDRVIIKKQLPYSMLSFFTERFYYNQAELREAILLIVVQKKECYIPVPFFSDPNLLVNHLRQLNIDAFSMLTVLEKI